MEAGHAVTQFCVEPRQELRSWQQPLPVTGLVSRLVRHANWRARQWGMVEPLPWEYWFGLRRHLSQFDLIHFHDLFMAISPQSLKAVADHKPVVLTVHDTSVFTGGCINPQGCQRFKNECGGCPQRSELGRLDFTSSNLRRVRRLAKHANINYVYPSEWIQRESSHSLSSVGRVDHIPNGFDPRSYQFSPRENARNTLGLAQNRKIVVVSAAALESKLKGIRFALEAIAANQDLEPLLVLIGQPILGIEKKLQGVSFLLTGFVKDRARLGLFLAAADLLLYPSLGDNLPITIQEAMAAGTPVLAFDVGGVPELVRPGVSGWLVPTGDQAAMNAKLREVLLSGEMPAYGARARALMAEEFSVARCVQRHEQLYQSILAARSRQNTN